MGRHRGAVLIVVLGILAILALLATTFATLQATERRVSRNYLDRVRARLLAQSGVEHAAAQLRETFPFRAFPPPGVAAPQPWKYWGRDKTETVEPGAVRIEEAVNPSFALERETPFDPTDPRVEPRTIRIDGKERGVSGVHASGTYVLHGDHYVLKVSDLSGRIYVNDGLDGGPDGSVSQNLKRILNVLGDVVSVPRLGDRILASRPASGYPSAHDLLKAVGGDESLWLRFRDFVTVHAWKDPNVALPVPLSAGALGQYPVTYARGNPPLYRLGSGKDCAGQEAVPPGGLLTCPTACPGGSHNHPAIRLYGLDTLNPQWIEIVSRAPVNVNTAPREVLVALLAELRGFFLADRRRNNPNWKSDFYTIMPLQSNFSPDGTEGDEIGFLMETVPIRGPGSTVSDGISAFVLADEIIACRHRRASANFDYASVPWGGSFRSWNQFNLFVDNLVTIGVIKDDRPIHFDYEEDPGDATGYGALVPSELQRRHAARATADALKANFNPNLHLNELNPDENLHLRVDKTDLFVNSTEFCFLPTGYFEVESLGRVVRAKDGADALAASDNELVAQAKVTAVLKLYDLYRETAQRQFAAGTFTPRQGAFETNNNMSLEVGPEPDNGVFPGNHGAPGEPDNEWGGYLALPTVGGVLHDGGQSKPPNSLQRTVDLPADPQFGSAFHVHFTRDFDAHHHVVDRREIASANLPDETVANYPDRVAGQDLDYPGPYDPTKGPPNAHRLARSFRQRGRGGTGTEPELPPFAPSDLRIDGGYAERHASPAYVTSTSGGAVWNFNDENARGMVSFWWKPSFAPELTGKARVPWDFTRYHACFRGGGPYYPFPCVLWFFPTHYTAAIAESSQPVYSRTSQCHPMSLVWGSLQWHTSQAGPITWQRASRTPSHSFGNMTTSLNHIGHPDEAVKPSPLRAHRWINTTLSWNLPGRFDMSGNLSRLYVNGSLHYSRFNVSTMRGDAAHYDKMMYWDKHDGGEYNHMRLGAPSKVCNVAVITNRRGAMGAFSGNHTADATIDEFYVWKESPETSPAVDPSVLWLRGRYYRPDGDGLFDSQAIAFPTGIRQPPPASGVTGPGSTATALRPGARVLGVAWTWYGEATDPAAGRPVLYDHNSAPGADLRPLQPKVRVGVRDGATAYGPFEDDGFSAVRAPDGSTPTLQDPAKVRYFVEFRIDDADASTVLLATPVLDDVTVYWESVQGSILSYAFDGRSF
jgi:hypothetical protein